MKTYKFISTLRFLNIELKEPFTLMPGIELISNKNEISKVLDEEFKNMAGIIETDHFINANNIIFCEFDEKDFTFKSSHEALLIWLIWVEILIKDSWLVKENSITCDIAYMKMTDGTHVEWSNNSLMAHTSLSSGEEFIETTFSYKELLEWESKSNRLQSYLHEKDSSILKSFTEKKFSRIGRALRFIIAANREKHTAIKIAHYCSALESLFSTDNSELSHKLSERIALFLKNYGYDPFIVFDDIKSFYNIRSKVTHGDSLQSKKADTIPELSKKCDSYLRCIINEILDDSKLIDIFEGTKEIQEKYFKELILSK
ncbi:MAG: hypothetical protein COA44_08580 [Arcobacter sp.]|nr:MAG: hypothetical protein COA44_08580 [Arcobacter sp.]